MKITCAVTSEQTCSRQNVQIYLSSGFTESPGAVSASPKLLSTSARLFADSFFTRLSSSKLGFGSPRESRAASSSLINSVARLNRWITQHQKQCIRCGFNGLLSGQRHASMLFRPGSIPNLRALTLLVGLLAYGRQKSCSNYRQRFSSSNQATGGMQSSIFLCLSLARINYGRVAAGRATGVKMGVFMKVDCWLVQMQATAGVPTRIVGVSASCHLVIRSKRQNKV